MISGLLVGLIGLIGLIIMSQGIERPKKRERDVEWLVGGADRT